MNVLPKEKIAKNRISIIVVLLCILSLIGDFIINFKLAEIYVSTDGKGRLLFGICENLYLPYKYGVAIILIAAMALNLLTYSRKENKILTRFGSVLIIVSIILLFLRIWRLMI